MFSTTNIYYSFFSFSFAESEWVRRVIYDSLLWTVEMVEEDCKFQALSFIDCFSHSDAHHLSPTRTHTHVSFSICTITSNSLSYFHIFYDFSKGQTQTWSFFLFISLSLFRCWNWVFYEFLAIGAAANKWRNLFFDIKQNFHYFLENLFCGLNGQRHNVQNKLFYTPMDVHKVPENNFPQKALK